ncbi:hypothetical protein AI2983V1_1918 [Enterobacter cloacae]|nr:hypothetical protein AI2983V1_1918 [Enterobacter cloacae]CAH5611382.1 hypothetical protein AI2983V1_1918 [Enterobacter cloacae]
MRKVAGCETGRSYANWGRNELLGVIFGAFYYPTFSVIVW